MTFLPGRLTGAWIPELRLRRRRKVTCLNDSARRAGSRAGMRGQKQAGTAGAWIPAHAGMTGEKAAGLGGGRRGDRRLGLLVLRQPPRAAEGIYQSPRIRGRRQG